MLVSRNAIVQEMIFSILSFIDHWSFFPSKHMKTKQRFKKNSDKGFFQQYVIKFYEWKIGVSGIFCTLTQTLRIIVFLATIYI